MSPKPIITIKHFFLLLTISMVLIATLFLLSLFDTHSKIVFCDVGQGDAAYIRVHNRIDILIDAGPDNSVLECLGRHMPFWDKTIEYSFISHPQKDHYGGYSAVLDHYTVKNLYAVALDNEKYEFAKQITLYKKKGVRVQYIQQGNTLSVLSDTLTVLWPTQTFITENSYVPEQSVLGASTLDANDFSEMLLFSEGKIKVLFSGDISPKILQTFIDYDNKIVADIKNVSILKVPHHGSKNGLIVSFLSLAKPTHAVISVGKRNRFGHPSKEVLDMLHALHVPYSRTDRDGDVVFVIDDGKIKKK